jgi:hypothetical protein
VISRVGPGPKSSGFTPLAASVATTKQNQRHNETLRTVLPMPAQNGLFGSRLRKNSCDTAP